MHKSGGGHVALQSWWVSTLLQSWWVSTLFQGLGRGPRKRQRGDSNPCGQSPMDF